MSTVPPPIPSDRVAPIGDSVVRAPADPAQPPQSVSHHSLPVNPPRVCPECGLDARARAAERVGLWALACRWRKWWLLAAVCAMAAGLSYNARRDFHGTSSRTGYRSSQVSVESLRMITDGRSDSEELRRIIAEIDIPPVHADLCEIVLSEVADPARTIRSLRASLGWPIVWTNVWSLHCSDDAARSSSRYVFGSTNHYGVGVRAGVAVSGGWIDFSTMSSRRFLNVTWMHVPLMMLLSWFSVSVIKSISIMIVRRGTPASPRPPASSRLVVLNQIGWVCALTGVQMAIPTWDVWGGPVSTDRRTSPTTLNGRDLVYAASHPESAPGVARALIDAVDSEVTRTGVAWSDRLLVHRVLHKAVEQSWYGIRPLGLWGWVGVVSVGTLREHPQHPTGRSDSFADLGWSVKSIDREILIFLPTVPGDTSQRFVTFHWDMVLINLLLVWLVWRAAVMMFEFVQRRRERLRWARGECVGCGYPVREPIARPAS